MGGAPPDKGGRSPGVAAVAKARRHAPVRTCVGCRAAAPRAELVRFATVEGRVVPDPRASAPGRGAWLHQSRDCWDAAVARRGFNRAFRAPVNIPDETVDFTRTWPRSASTS